jgi:hypothetical protein
MLYRVVRTHALCLMADRASKTTLGSQVVTGVREASNLSRVDGGQDSVLSIPRMLVHTIPLPVQTGGVSRIF